MLPRRTQKAIRRASRLRRFSAAIKRACPQKNSGVKRKSVNNLGSPVSLRAISGRVGHDGYGSSKNEAGVVLDRPMTLEFADGMQIQGKSFGALTPMNGEVVFNTGMVGYIESLTDPSYAGQILCMTYPLVGNYGVPDTQALDEFGILAHLESHKIQVAGLIVADYSPEYSHWRAKESLAKWLQREGIPAIYGVDTRMITKKVREHGAILGKLFESNDPAGQKLALDDPNLRNLVGEVSLNEPRTFNPSGDAHIVAVDCGIKNSIIRDLCLRGAKVTVVPWNYDFTKIAYDGLFISNGPGDPTVPKETYGNLKKAFALDKPIFGICLGTQMMALAAGASTYKLPYGHRGHNIPCVDQLSNRCYITSQNHGFAVSNHIPEGWAPYFLNDNDGSVEGLVHTTKPFFSTQFHPEAAGGPTDTKFLFDKFLKMTRQYRDGQHVTMHEVRGLAEKVNSYSDPVGKILTSNKSILESVTLGTFHPSDPPPINFQRKALPRKVLVLGSGGLQIGQAGEFDYSGSQAIKALKEEGIETVLINPNIATVQTAEGLADRVYFTPVDTDFVSMVIAKERPDGIMLQFGGQTALNTGLTLAKSGVLGRYGVSVLGTSVDTIEAAEDREIFARKLIEINEFIAPSIATYNIEDSLAAAEKLGYPVVLRAAFSLGGLNSGFAHNPEELKTLATRAFTSSPQVLIEKSVKGWKEVEYEVVRDAYNNTVTVCNMENYDPLGIHTGDSIVIAPSQTLDDKDYHMLRNTAIRIANHFGVVGECNVQYALDPNSDQYYVIEINPRLSRSSALASKATGYPLAFVAAKLALGYQLPSLKNSITQTTPACFEPSLDYVVTKFPKWDLAKFSRVSSVLGTSMKSVGEVMAIDRTWEASMQKAVRMVDPGMAGYQGGHFENLDEALVVATDKRAFAVFEALDRGYSVEKIYQMTKIDPWWLYKCQNVVHLTQQLRSMKQEDVSKDLMGELKLRGFGDKQIANLLNDSDATEDSVRAMRKSYGITPWVKQIDTLAAEYPAQTNYLYVTYQGSEHDVEFGDSDAMILGGGTYKIGSSVEFDYSAVSCLRTMRELGKNTVMVNYNPETVSTDYDETERLYFDELSLERVQDINDLEQPSHGICVSVGGQIPNNLALPLLNRDVQIMGTSPRRIDNAEDRNKFSTLCDELGIDQPEWSELTTYEEARDWCQNRYPVLVRPSYVLSGGGMGVIRDEASLQEYLEQNSAVSREFPVVVSKFEEGAREYDIDAVADKGEMIAYAVASHIEDAGVHSGDATLVIPPHDIDQADVHRIADVGLKLAKGLEISGPFNAQILITPDGRMKVIECNVRASRSLPFMTKTTGINFIELAAKIFLGVPYEKPQKKEYNHVGVKAAQFSFTRLLGADPTLGVEMASTGEVACYGENMHEAFLKALLSTHFKLPRKNILISAGSELQKEQLLPYVRQLETLGYQIYSTPGTHSFLTRNNVESRVCHFPLSPEHPQAKDLLSSKSIDLVINIPSKNKVNQNDEKANCYLLRRAAVDYSTPLLTDQRVAEALIDALSSVTRVTVEPFDYLWQDKTYVPEPIDSKKFVHHNMD